MGLADLWGNTALPEGQKYIGIPCNIWQRCMVDLTKKLLRFVLVLKQDVYNLFLWSTVSSYVRAAIIHITKEGGGSQKGPSPAYMNVFNLVRPNEPYQPDPNLTRILILRAKPTQLNPILDAEGPTRPENGSSWVQIGGFKVHYRVEPEIEPFLRSTRTDWTRFYILRANQKQVRFGKGHCLWFGHTSLIISSLLNLPSLYYKTFT